MSTINRSPGIQNHNTYETGSRRGSSMGNQKTLPSDEKIQEIKGETLLHLESKMPTALSTLKDYAQTNLTVLPISLSLATMLAIFQAATNRAGLISPMSLVTGALAGFIASSVTRSMSNLVQEGADQESNSPQYLSKIVTSPPFLGGLASSVALGVISGAGSLVFSTPLLAAGALLHYGIKNLHEQQFISKEGKDVLQQIFSVAVSTLALMNPVRTTVSLVVGGALGGLIEGVCTKNKANKPVES